MTAILVAPDLELMLVEQQGVFTIPSEDAVVACNCPAGKACVGMEIDKIALSQRKFELLARELLAMFTDRLEPRGYGPVAGSFRLHGPFLSYDFNKHMQDVESDLWKQAHTKDRNGDEHPELALAAVFERSAFDPYKDYVIVGKFLKRAVLTEVIVPDGD